MGLTAMLTPYLLVIVSTTPTAHTQHKAARPKDVSPHSTLSGCVAWYPAIKRKSGGKDIADAKLVYCWSNVISILEVKIQNNLQDPERAPNLEFTTRSRWRAEEPIVAVQWLARSVLGALTISQRLLIIDDNTLQVTDSLDLLPRRIYHQDLFSKQLHAVVEQLDQDDISMHGVVADAFYMSFRAYKGRLFILSFNDLAVGTLSNWADRLVALMEAGDHIAAIRLSTGYYAGGAGTTIGLPENEVLRHEMVKERLIAMVTASLQYTFAQQGDDRSNQLRELADVAFEACIVMQEKAFLLNEVFEYYLDDDQDALFVQALEPYILDEEIQSVPPILVKSVVSYYISQQQSGRLEDLLCRLEPTSFDLDQVTTLCKQHNLYDALIFVWTQALKDFVTPLVDLLSLVKVVEPGQDDPFSISAMKVFPYLAFTLTGREYPSGQFQEDSQATTAKNSLYSFLLSGRPLAWPPGSKEILHTVSTDEDEPAYPYLTLLLQFDTSSFMSMMNEAFEDPYLNKNEEEMTNGSRAVNGSNRLKMTRQHLVDIMLTTMKQDIFDDEQRVFLDMFIARNLPKYSTELVFTGSLLDTIFQHLCHPPSDELHDDCQLSIEYLLSVYQPPDTTALLGDLREARFYRVMKTIYRRQKLFSELFELYFVDPDDKEGIYDFVLSSMKLANPKQVAIIKSSIIAHSDELVMIDTTRTAQMIARLDVKLLEPVIENITESSRTLVLLRFFFKTGSEKDSSITPLSDEEQTLLEERYVKLMCLHDPTRVADYLGHGQSGDLRLAELLPAMEEHGVIDAEVMLLRKHGLYADAMKRLVQHLDNLRQTMTSLLEAVAQSPDITGTMEAATDLMQEIVKYTKIGLWLSQSFEESRPTKPAQSLLSLAAEGSLSLCELLWLNLLDAVVNITQAISEALHGVKQQMEEHVDDIEQLQSSLRTNVQQTFTALLVASSSISTSSQLHKALGKDSFLRILRAFLQRAAASAQSISDLRDVLADIFAAYAFEQDVLTMANDLLGADVFTDIQKAYELRQRGWRPRGSACELCKRKAWGPGIGDSVWEEYKKRELELEDKRTARWKNADSGKRQERGKGKAEQHVAESTTEQEGNDGEKKRLTLVLFSCRHVFHRACLEEKRSERDDGKFRCPLCIDEK
ncbi:hypothetical protein MRB53_041250 [Persea americana]|nr:hypothetical protein MRB53_041250 [Persea americana]